MREVIFPKESGIEPCNWLADRSRSTRISLELDNQGTIDEERWLNERSRIARDLEELTKERAEGTMIYKSAGSHPGLTGWTGSRVDRVSPGQFSSGFLPPPGPVPGPGRPAGPVRVLKLYTQVMKPDNPIYIYIYNLNSQSIQY
jgi:hypothetical protein